MHDLEEKPVTLRRLALALACLALPGCDGCFEAGSPGSVPVSNTPPSAFVFTPAGVQVSDIPIAYTLMDAQGDTLSVLVQFSVDSGTSWSPATAAPLGDGTAGLASSAGGTPHLFMWASRLDGVALAGPVATVRIRVTPFDTVTGTPGETLDFTVDNRVAVYRISDLDLRDPHVFVSFLGCWDVTDASVFGQPSVNDVLQAQIQSDGNGDGDLDWTGLLIFRIPNQSGAGGRVDFALGISPAPHPPATADLDPAFVPVPTTYANVASGTVLQPGAGTTRPYVPPVASPSGPGFATTGFSVTLSIGAITLPLQDVQIGAAYVGDPATQLASGLLMGFLSETAADATTINLGFGSVSLSSLLPGGAGN